MFILGNILKVDTNVQKTSHFLCRYLYFFDVCLRKILKVDANVQKTSHSLCSYLCDVCPVYLCDVCPEKDS